jgi:hypothetical protein
LVSHTRFFVQRGCEVWTVDWMEQESSDQYRK